MIYKAYILVGGRGTRLADVVNDVPKPMAPVLGLPFLHYQLYYLKKVGIREVVLIAGYKKDSIIGYFGNEYLGLKINYLHEDTPRGTGGFIYEISKSENNPILLLNGDTYFEVDIQAMFLEFQKSNTITIAVKEMLSQDRYGALDIEENQITHFREKSFFERGYINGGIYILNPKVVSSYSLPDSFSLEVDFFMKKTSELLLVPFYSDGYFIDIGVPEDYRIAQDSIPFRVLSEVDSTWTLFLDRDGVLNKHLIDSYVRNIEEFVWEEGVLEGLQILSKVFSRIVVVTNQQGIGKGLMTEHDLNDIHWKMQNDVEKVSGRIDRFYYCPHLANIQCSCRKPGVLMAYNAQKDFPLIDFNKSIMIGDSNSDIEFGYRLGMLTVKIGNVASKKEALKLNSLRAFSRFFE